jgi:hypothetical protein
VADVRSVTTNIFAFLAMVTLVRFPRWPSNVASFPSKWLLVLTFGLISVAATLAFVTALWQLVVVAAIAVGGNIRAVYGDAVATQVGVCAEVYGWIAAGFLMKAWSGLGGMLLRIATTEKVWDGDQSIASSETL